MDYIKIKKGEDWKAEDIEPLTEEMEKRQEKFYEGLAQRVGDYLSKKE